MGSARLPPAADILSILNDSQALPKLVVFDLDFTLWPFWVDTHVRTPIKADQGGTTVHDRAGVTFTFYSEVQDILSALRSHGIAVGAASRTQAPDLACQMLRMLHFDDTTAHTARPAIEYFDQLEIYPGTKTKHFERLQEKTGIAYKNMLFFDDEARNLNVGTLGVHMCLVEDGMSLKEFARGIEEWRKRQ